MNKMIASKNAIFSIIILLKMLIAAPISAIPPIKVQNLGNGIYLGTISLIALTFIICPKPKLYSIIAYKYIPIGAIFESEENTLCSGFGALICEINKKPPDNAKTLLRFIQNGPVEKRK